MSWPHQDCPVGISRMNNKKSHIFGVRESTPCCHTRCIANVSQSQIVFMAFKNSVITLKNVRVWCLRGATPEGVRALQVVRSREDKKGRI